MHIKIRNDFLYANVISVILIMFVYISPDSILRIILATPFLLFLPGYTLLSALNLRKEEIEPFSLFIMSLGLSVAVIALIGMLLGYSFIGLSMESVLYSMSIFILITSVIAWWRRKRTDVIQPSIIEFDLSLRTFSKNRRETVRIGLIAVTVMMVSGILAYTLVYPKQGEFFTEFYVLNQQGESSNYPDELRAGISSSVILGIKNDENRDMDYWVEITLDGKLIKAMEPISVPDTESTEITVSFTPDTEGDNQKLEFVLYRDNQAKPYRTVYFWVNVSRR